MNVRDLGLRLILSPGRFPDKNHLDKYNKMYQCWLDVWSAALAEAKKDENPTLWSDTFTRQDFIASIFLGEECIALALFRHMDTDMITTEKDSYFWFLNQEQKQTVLQLGKNIFSCSYLSVHPNARQDKLGISIKELMVGICAEMSVQSAADVMVAMPRKGKNVHSSVYRWGATHLFHDVPWHSDSVDIAAFYKRDVLSAQHEMSSVIQSLWDQREVIQMQEFETVNSFISRNVIPFKKAA